MMKEIMQTRRKEVMRSVKQIKCISLHYIGLIRVDRRRLKFGGEPLSAMMNGADLHGSSLLGVPAEVAAADDRLGRASVN